MSDLISFLTWVAANVPALVGDIQEAVKAWSGDKGFDPSPYLRAINPDQHEQVDKDIDAEISTVYAEKESPTKG